MSSRKIDEPPRSLRRRGDTQIPQRILGAGGESHTPGPPNPPNPRPQPHPIPQHLTRPYTPPESSSMINIQGPEELVNPDFLILFFQSRIRNFSYHSHKVERVWSTKLHHRAWYLWTFADAEKATEAKRAINNRYGEVMVLFVDDREANRLREWRAARERLGLQDK